ncbi:PAAR-like domain-containing protein [Rhizobium phaseoli]|uniref:PAAR-like domain-containing protein n=1 Tax=Rhizobium phaseoli TaxID=396 RepID=UPI0006372AAC|nr:PAAR-like domain-containing protein [Rhizobium phaseoli]ANM08422.1 PAAR motif-containing protein [Rhizobium phaseoli]KKZ84304.1 putative nuclease toxin [Rhizobium phaseoli Ch24-10]
MTVFANGLEVACKAQANKVIAAFPYVCFTPPQTPATPPGVPVPYPTFGLDSDTDNGTSTVKIGGQTVTQKNKSYYTKCSGNEAGCAPKKNLITSVNTGKEYAHAWSGNVRMDGEPVSRFTDISSNDHASPTGGGPPWPKIASLDLGLGNCVAILQSIGLNVHKHGHKGEACNPQGRDPPLRQSDHIMQNRCFTSGGRTGYLSNWPNYTEYSAPCVCLNDGTSPTSEHGRKSQKQKAYAARWRSGGKTTVKFSTVKKNNMDAMKSACKRLAKNQAALACLSEIIDIYFMHAAGVSTKEELNAMECAVPG